MGNNYSAEKRRHMSSADAVAMAFGTMVGWGAFVMPGTTFLPVAGPAGTVIAMTEGFDSWQSYINSLDKAPGIESVPTFYAAKAVMGQGGLILAGVTALAAVLTGIIGGSIVLLIIFAGLTVMLYVQNLVRKKHEASEREKIRAMDGYAAAKAIRGLENRQLAEIPILAMTANAFKEDEETALAAGMQAHIAKPVDVNILLSKLYEVLFTDDSQRRDKQP